VPSFQGSRIGAINPGLTPWAALLSALRAFAHRDYQPVLIVVAKMSATSNGTSMRNDKPNRIPPCLGVSVVKNDPLLN